MENKISKIARLVREELSSIKVMILAIMLSFGLVLSIMNFLVNIFYSLEMIVDIKSFVRSPYDKEMNDMISGAINISMVIQFVQFFLSFIPLLLLTYGVYLMYSNAKDGVTKITGMKFASGVMKYHGIVAFFYAAFLMVIGVLSVVLAIIFGKDLGQMVGDTSDEFSMALIVVAIMLLIVFFIVAVVFILKGVLIICISKNIKYVSNTQKGIVPKKMSVLGGILFILSGVSTLSNILSSFTSMGLTSDDVEMLEEMFGGEVAHFLVDMMPSDVTQFEVVAVSIAYTFFIGVAQVLAGIVLLSIRNKVNKTLDEQEFTGYGGNNFISSNQC